MIRETILGSLALLAFFVLSNTDIVIARNVLDSHQAGLYAGGLILTKAVLFLPQFVVVVAFPSMSTVAVNVVVVLSGTGVGIPVLVNFAAGRFSAAAPLQLPFV